MKTEHTDGYISKNKIKKLFRFQEENRIFRNKNVIWNCLVKVDFLWQVWVGKWGEVYIVYRGVIDGMELSKGI